MPRPSTRPRPTTGPLLLVALCLATLLIPLSAGAADAVGRVLIASGDVTAQREGAPARSLSRKDPIHARDTIETGADGRIQIQFSDGGMVDLQPDTRFRIAEYELDEDGGGSAVMEFLRGALRTVTGSIGDDEDDEYRMETPVATIGIRGTAYALHYCDAACAEAGGELGLYGHVDDGSITVGSGSDAITIGNGQFFFVPEGGAPRQIVAPPDGILDGNGDNGDGDDGTDPAPGDTLPPEDDPSAGLTGDGNNPFDPTFEADETTELDVTVERPGETGDVIFAGAFFNEDTSGSTFLLSPGDGDVRLRDSAADAPVVGADFPDPNDPSDDIFVDASMATLEEQGTTDIGPFGDPTTIVWGRWDGPVQTDGDGDGGGFVYAYSDSASLTPPSSLMSRSNQSADYNNLLNGPYAVASNGDLWDLASIDLRLDFDANDAFLDIFNINQVAGGSLMLSLDSTGIMGSINDASSSLSIDSFNLGSNSWEGDLEGRFVGDNGEALIIKYDLNETSGNNTIRGVAIVEEPS